MQKFLLFMFGVGITAIALVPFYAYAVGVPFGGIVDAVTPCTIGPTPALWINVLGFDFVDVLTLPPIGTLPFPYYTPTIGQWILGEADSPITCLVGAVPLPPGLRIQMFGTSLPLGTGESTGAGAALNGHGLY